MTRRETCWSLALHTACGSTCEIQHFTKRYISSTLGHPKLRRYRRTGGKPNDVGRLVTGGALHSDWTGTEGQPGYGSL